MSSCQTIYGTKSLTKVPKRTTTVRLPYTHTMRLVSYVTRTITPAAVTRTKTLSKATTTTRRAVQQTDTTTLTLSFDEFITVTSTKLSISTIIEVTTTTTSPKGSILTISTSSGFIPIQSVSGNLPLRKRALNVDLAAAPTSYPASVVCSVVLKKNVYTTATDRALRTTIRTAETPTIFKTSTRISTSRVTNKPERATVTTTEKITSTSTSIIDGGEETTSTTVTSTSTIEVLPTAYPGCQTHNYFSTHNGSPIYNGSPVDPNFTGAKNLAAPDAETCCHACQQSEDCGMFIHSAQNGYTTFHTSVCAAQSHFYNLYSTGSAEAPMYVLGNGNCGYSKWALSGP
jgi:hypothetical protein